MHPSAVRRLVIITVIVWLGMALPAFAQQKKIGLVVGYPATVGVLWNITDRVALRADGSVQWSSYVLGTPLFTEEFPDQVFPGLTASFLTSASISTETKSINTGIGLSAQITLSRADRFATYLSPRMSLGITHSTTRTEYDLSGMVVPLPGFRFEPQESSGTSTSPTASLLGGAMVSVHDRFTVFAEAGFGYSWSGSLAPGSDLDRDSRSHTLYLRSGIGAVIYF
jgi:hypothetical protein